MPVRGMVIGLWFITTILSCAASPQENEHAPTMLLTPKLLRRLQRDRQRQTVRWLNFEKRVQNAPDSPERGFELALHYAVTHEEQRGSEAVQWALAHPCEQRQVALVMDWVGDAISPANRKLLEASSCAAKRENDPAADIRDELFAAVARAKDPRALIARRWPVLRSGLADRLTASDIYAVCEFLIVARDAERSDLRNDDAHFFSLLPKELLLSLDPAQVEHPEWRAHIGALALVGLDPNLENSQFLQAWAMEDRQMLTAGPGVAYEFLWADPYLPGIAYQNMDPWIYDPSGRLFARTNWDPDACWLAVTPKRVAQENCPGGANGLVEKASYGTLTLIPMAASCTEIAARKGSGTTMLWKMSPNEELTYENGGRRVPARADPAGIWPVPNETNGKVCAAKQRRH